MGVFEYYLIFMLSVGVWAAYELMQPAIQILYVTNPDDVLVQNKLLSYFIMFCVGALIAPLMVLIILVPSLNEACINAMTLNREK